MKTGEMLETLLTLQNLYHLLGNDVEEDEPSNVTPREVVKKTSSSKKKDEAPSKADPAKAKNKKKVTGNEGAIKSKLNNKDVPAPASTASSHYKRPFDRHSRQSKGDSDKKTKQGWGSKEGTDILQDEVEAEEDAVAELEEDDENVVDEVPKKSLQDYFEELKLKQSELEGNKQIRQANEGGESKWTAEERLEKQRKEYVSASAQKKTKAKNQKEKKFLDFEATFADDQPTPFPSEKARGGYTRGRGGQRGSTRGRGAPRGSTRGRGAPRGGAPRGGSAPRGSSKPVVNDKNFPSL